MELMLYLIIISVLNIVSTHMLLTRKRSFVYCTVAFTLNTVIVFGAAILAQRFIGNLILLKYIIYFLAFTYLAYIMVVFTESKSKKIFAMFSIWMFSTIILFFATSLSNVFFSGYDEDFVRRFVFIVRICLQGGLALVLFFTLHESYKKVTSVISDKTVNIIVWYPVLAFILLIKNNSVTFGKYRDFNSEFDVILFLLFISLGYILIFAGIYSSSKVIALQYNYKIVENQVESQRENYRKLGKSIEMLYTLKHDMRHHFSVLKVMIQEAKNKQALEYIEQFNKSEIFKTAPILCANFAADSIIKYYMSMAIERGIEFTSHANIPEDIGINSLDLCVVLGNGLDNAIDACDRHNTAERKYIDISAKIVGSHIVFNISNSFDGKIEKLNDVMKSRKNGPGHGIGLSSIKETVTKYNGDIDYKYTDEKFEIIIFMCTGITS